MIVRDVPQVEVITCEVIRFTEKGNPNGKIARRKRDESGKPCTVWVISRPGDMGKAKLLEVQW
jgi:hypothetical protein